MRSHLEILQLQQLTTSTAPRISQLFEHNQGLDGLDG